MLCKCSGKYIDIYFNLKITFRFTILLLSVFLYISIYLHIFWFVTVISKPFMGGVIINEPGFTGPAGSAPPS